MGLFVWLTVYLVWVGPMIRRQKQAYEGVGKMALHEVKLCLLGVSAVRVSLVVSLLLTAPALLRRPLPPPPLQESGVGKTCIVNRFVSDVFTEHESLTVG